MVDHPRREMQQIASRIFRIAFSADDRDAS